MLLPVFMVPCMFNFHRMCIKFVLETMAKGLYVIILPICDIIIHVAMVYLFCLHVIFGDMMSEKLIQADSNAPFCC